jgi:translation initiation factor IF-3
VPRLRLIGADGKQIGIVSREEALKRAMEEGLDLVEIVPTANPPVCKIMDYGRYKYEKSKSEKHRRKPVVIKEIKLGMNIQEADIEVKLRHAREFLAHGNKVKVSLRFRGREIIYAKRGKEVLWKFAKALEGVGVIEQVPTVNETIATTVIAPIRDAKTQVK